MKRQRRREFVREAAALPEALGSVLGLPERGSAWLASTSEGCSASRASWSAHSTRAPAYASCRTAEATASSWWTEGAARRA
jgi:hypothetical protein